MPMTWTQRDLRRDARMYGKIAQQYITNALGFQQEAERWRELEAAAGTGPVNSPFWQRRADQLQQAAVHYTRLAVRAATKSLTPL